MFKPLTTYLGTGKASVWSVVGPMPLRPLDWLTFPVCEPQANQSELSDASQPYHSLLIPPEVGPSMYKHTRFTKTFTSSNSINTPSKEGATIKILFNLQTGQTEAENSDQAVRGRNSWPLALDLGSGCAAPPVSPWAFSRPRALAQTPPSRTTYESLVRSPYVPVLAALLPTCSTHHPSWSFRPYKFPHVTNTLHQHE